MSFSIDSNKLVEKKYAGLPLERGALPLYQGLPVVPVDLRYVDGRFLGGARKDKISPRIPHGCNSSSGREVLVEHGGHLGGGRGRAPIPAHAAEFCYRRGLGCVLKKMRGGGLGYGRELVPRPGGQANEGRDEGVCPCGGDDLRVVSVELVDSLPCQPDQVPLEAGQQLGEDEDEGLEREGHGDVPAIRLQGLVRVCEIVVSYDLQPQTEDLVLLCRGEGRPSARVPLASVQRETHLADGGSPQIEGQQVKGDGGIAFLKITLLQPGLELVYQLALLRKTHGTVVFRMTVLEGLELAHVLADLEPDAAEEHLGRSVVLGGQLSHGGDEIAVVQVERTAGVPEEIRVRVHGDA